LRKVLEENLTTLKDISKTQAFNSGDDIKKYNDVVSQTTTNVKAFEMAQKDADEATEQFNKEVENSIENQKKVKKIIDDVNGSLDANIARQTQNKTLLADIKRRQNLLNKEYQRGQISLSKYNRATTKNNKEIAQLTVANSKLGFAIKAQVKQGQEAESSFNAQAQRLGQLKAAYRNLTEAERENLDVGGKLLKELKKLD
jgi:chromosome segregation ATPase